ncbi:hypothetical protein DKX38_005297 [Salix brachista]|uniref:Uncharacterized protein n=1 Tax=Salix brachista TaxID=2182728 RepID=A0A5N5NEY4_9ROSI|nr:hypothetical protein DKX38_005297 [Salix brachista]
MGDFNATLKASDSSGGDPNWVGHRLSTKLTLVKAHLIVWHRNNRSGISGRVVKAKEDWSTAQIQLDNDPQSEEFKEAERAAAINFNQLSRDEEAYYKQKSRINWLTLGDRNTTFFHRSMRHRHARNRISSLVDKDGILIDDPDKMGEGFQQQAHDGEYAQGGGHEDYKNSAAQPQQAHPGESAFGMELVAWLSCGLLGLFSRLGFGAPDSFARLL